jgi:hypothetical protein
MGRMIGTADAQLHGTNPSIGRDVGGRRRRA